MDYRDAKNHGGIDMAKCWQHTPDAAAPSCPMCQEFYGVTPPPAPAPPPPKRPANTYRAPLAHSRMTTLPELPMSRIIKVCGLVSYVAADSGWTATSKGNNALEGAFDEIGRQASDLGADAVVGIALAAFGARGGVTSVVGGDAVGIALVGTAVVTERVDSESEKSRTVID